MPMISLERIRKALEKFFRLKDFRPGQLEIITSVLNGFDTLAVMPTGGGKSICYQLPALLSDGLTVVITPLVSLMKDQVAQVNRMGQVATQLDSSLDLDEVRARLHLARSGKVKLLYVAPERLESKRFVETLSKIKVSLLAVDEAHCISQWGHDFRPSYVRIAEFGSAVGTPVILALTATATPDVQDDIVSQLRMRSPRVYIRGFARPNLSFSVQVERAKTKYILDYVSKTSGSGIIYAATRKSTDELSDFLNSRGIQALRYHPGMTEADRSRSQSEFLSSSRVIVATNAFGMGINKPDVRYVIHSEIPGTLEAYYQEAGRAGRDGLPAECILLFHKKDLELHEFFLNTLYPTREEFTTAYTAIFDRLNVAVGAMPDEYLTISSHDVSGATRLNARTVDSVLRILSTNRLIQLMPSISANAYVRAVVDMDSYRRAIEKTASHDSKAVLEAILRIHGNAVFSERRALRTDEVAMKTGIGPSNIVRTLSILHRSGIIQYIPPSEGTTFRMLSGRSDTAHLPIDFNLLEKLRQRAHERLLKVVGFAKTTGCRSNYILTYFGADETPNGCGNCDNCSVTSTYGTADDAGLDRVRQIHKSILSLAKAVEGKFGRATYCKILLGEAGRDKVNDETAMEYFGALNQLPQQAVYSAFDFLVARKFLARQGSIYPTYALTNEGKEYLDTGIAPANRIPFVLRKALYKALRDERRALATELGLPIFAVCSDQKLIELSNNHPVKPEEILEFLPEGVPGAAKVRERLLQVCVDYSSERPEKLSGKESNIYELYLEKFTASEIAAALSMTTQGVIDTLETINGKGLPIDFRLSLGNRKFSLLESELRKTSDISKVRESVGDCEIAEIELVAKITGASS